MLKLYIRISFLLEDNNIYILYKVPKIYLKKLVHLEFPSNINRLVLFILLKFSLKPFYLDRNILLFLDLLPEYNLILKLFNAISTAVLNNS